MGACSVRRGGRERVGVTYMSTRAVGGHRGALGDGRAVALEVVITRLRKNRRSEWSEGDRWEGDERG